MTITTVIWIAGVCLLISIILIFMVFIQKLKRNHVEKRNQKIQEQIVEKFELGKNVIIKCKTKVFMHNFFLFSQKIQITKLALQETYEYLSHKKYIHKLSKNINSSSRYKRSRAITYLSLFGNQDTYTLLLDRLNVERQEHIKILIVNGLKNNLNEMTVKSIITSLISSRRYYQTRVIMILKKYIDQSKIDLSSYFDSPLIEIKESFIELAMQVYHPSFEKHLLDTLQEIENNYIYGNSLLLKNIRKPRIDRLYHQTLKALSTHYSFDLSSGKYLANFDEEVIKIAADSLTKSNDFESCKILLEYASQTSKDIIYAEAIDKICSSNKEFYMRLYEIFKSNIDMRQKILVASILSKKIDYFLLKIKNQAELEKLISTMIKSKYSVNIINWLNDNRDNEVEKKVLDVVIPIAKNNYEFYLELNEYLDKETFKRMGFIQTSFPAPEKPDLEPEIVKRRWLMLILMFITLTFPVLFIIFHITQIFRNPISVTLSQFVISLNKWFIVYYLLANFTYFTMSILAWFEYKRQERLWKIKSDDFLYEDGIITGISIIVPAYNEAVTIVESTRSLLNLKYPNYEVIVINDGSKDDTLQTLIDAYDLKRVDYYIENLIHTRNVKAVYRNKFYSKLSVVDKINGGKADSLNVGINFSENDYVCGIDADSLIESDSLLKMMSTVLDHDEITLALGGSIVPSNGATVDHGYVEKYELPKASITRFQSIEYIRAFNTGRLGFSKLKCLLIISGAFGLFEKRALIEAGGYLTASTKKKDTVGEDMELAVRITRRACEQNMDYRIEYIPMAQCYTEIPNKSKFLLSQRNRWQRGLIDTMSYHRKMILNRKYHTSGMIAMPYFFIFEMIGPLLETQVYIALLVGLIFGIFSVVYLLLLLVATVFFGIIISMISLLIQEKYTTPLSVKDTLILILFGIIENFGWRLFISIYRSKGYFSSLKNKHAWGSMTRQGFKK